MAREIIKWDETWILANFSKYPYITDLWRAYIDKTGQTIKKSTFKSHINRTMQLKSNATWTDREEQFLIKNYHKLGMFKCVQQLNTAFNSERTAQAVKVKALKMGLKVDQDVKISNHTNPRIKKVLQITDTGNEEFLRIKTGINQWERLHRYIYRTQKGNIPQGYKVIFLDGNKRNFNINNLVAVPTSYLALLNKQKLKSNNPQITDCALTWCDLHELLNERITRVKEYKK